MLIERLLGRGGGGFVGFQSTHNRTFSRLSGRRAAAVVGVRLDLEAIVGDSKEAH